MHQPDDGGEAPVNIGNWVLQADNVQQPSVNLVDTDSTHEIRRVPADLNGVVDRAVDVARLYRRLPYVRRDITNSIQRFLERYSYRRGQNTRQDIEQPTDFPTHQWEVIENLIVEVEHFYALQLRDKCKEAIKDLLNQFCHKVKDMKDGSLIALLELIGDVQFSHLILNLKWIAQQIRKLVINSCNLPSQVEKILRGNRRVDKSVKKMIPDLLAQIIKNIKINVSMRQRQMVKFLEDGAELTIKVQLLNVSSSSLKVTNKMHVQKFLAAFRQLSFTHNVLEEILMSKEDLENLVAQKQERLMDQDDKRGERNLAIKAMARGASAGGAVGAVGTMGAAAFLGALHVKLATGLIGTVAGGLIGSAVAAVRLTLAKAESEVFSDTDVFTGALPKDYDAKKLFEKCIKYGTVLNVTVAPRFTGTKYGFLEFTEPAGAKNAIDGFSDGNATKAMKTNSVDLTDNILMFRDLQKGTSQEQLLKKCRAYRKLIIRDECRVAKSPIRGVYYGYVRFVSTDAARRALVGFQSKGQFVTMAPKEFADAIGGRYWSLFAPQ